MYYLLYTMKDKTKIKASRPESDGSFYLYAIRPFGIKKGKFFEESEDDLPIVVVFYFKNYEFEIVSSSGCDKFEDTLLFHYIYRRMDKFIVQVTALEIIEKTAEGLRDSSLMLESPKEYLIRQLSKEGQDNEFYGDGLLNYIGNRLFEMQDKSREDLENDPIYKDFLTSYPGREDKFKEYIVTVRDRFLRYHVPDTNVQYLRENDYLSYWRLKTIVAY